MKKLFVTLALILSSILFSSLYAETRSPGDSVDVCSYSIHLNLPHLSNHTISGYSILTMTTSANNLTTASLYLLSMNIDSVLVDNADAIFQYNDTVLKVGLATPISQGDTIEIKIVYNGQPQQDPSGWGGFYFSSDSAYAFNLGVGFESIPHAYGRVWFPCTDNFTDRALYDVSITVQSGKMAVCGGTLMSVSHNAGLDTYHWRMHNTIPSYLASMAVGPYTAINDTFQGLNGNIPINIYADNIYSGLIATSFVNLKNILSIYETRFGPYRWERVGYVGVPFNSGAMEHSTNIAYPNVAFTGDLYFEDLMGHELAHQWFGDLMTCSTAGDMWINEGWASYCEAVFKESLYGLETYKSTIRNNHYKVVHQAHIDDYGYHALYNMPMDYTYSTTVYDKGTDVVHTLRHYMGDSLFFSSVKAMLSTYAFNSISSYEMRDFMSTASGINLTDFFDAWVFNPGFPHFSIDSFKITQTTPDIKARVWIRQRLDNAPSFAGSNHFEISFFNENWQQFTDTIIFSGEFASKEFTLPFVPDYAFLDYNEKVSDAVTDYNLIVKSNGNYDIANTLCLLEVSSISDSALVRIEHNWVAPDPMKIPDAGIKRLSDYRYWKIDGIFPQNFVSKCRFRYNRTTSPASGNLDNTLMPYSSSSDSLLLLYRPDPAHDWAIAPFKKIGSSSAGYLLADTLKRGEYTLAVGAPYYYNVDSHNPETSLLKVYPNPSGNIFIIEFSVAEKSSLKFFDASGNEIDEIKLKPGQDSVTWNPSWLKHGVYFVKLCNNKNKILDQKKLIYTK